MALPGLADPLRVTRAEFEDLIRPALADTVSAMERGLRSAGTAPTELTAIVLVGGSSRIPLVSETLSSAFTTPTAMDTHPEHDVALGAVQVGAHPSRRRPSRPTRPPAPAPSQRRPSRQC